MSSIEAIKHHNSSLNDLVRRAKLEGHIVPVVVNQRKLIDKMLAHYSSDFVVFRELIQNADDAQATLFQLVITCDCPSESSKEVNFHNRNIVEMHLENNGKIFTRTDWERVAAIAEGNTDVESVGQFGVGFYSVFAYTSEPVIKSGKEYMVFVWREDDSLMALHHKLPIEQQSDMTSISLKINNECVLKVKASLDTDYVESQDTTPTIDLAQLKAFFTRVLSFTKHITKLIIKINTLTVFEISKTKVIKPVVRPARAFKPQASLTSMLFLNSFLHTEQTFTILNGPSITLDHVVVEAKLTMDQRFHDAIRQVLKKSLPPIVSIQLLFMSTDIVAEDWRLQLSTSAKDLNTQLLRSILPLNFKNKEILSTGRIFIGLGTHQSTGTGIHVYSHFIPTIERENLDFQELHIAKWNEELLTSVGLIVRFLYEQTISQSSQANLNKYYNAIFAPYSFQATVPEKKVGDFIQRGFFASNTGILVPTKSSSLEANLKLTPCGEAYITDSKHIQAFFSLPLVPFEFFKNGLFTALMERGLINCVDQSVVKKQITEVVLLPDELLALVNWLYSDDVDDDRYCRRILANVRLCESVGSPIIFLKEIKYYSTSKISSVLPLPTNVLPMSIADRFSREQLQKRLFLLPCSFPDLFGFYLHQNMQYLFRNERTSTSLLSLFSQDSTRFSEHQLKQIQTVLSAIECIPTTHGMKLPSQSYIASEFQNQNASVITLNVSSWEGACRDANDDPVSVDFLKQIGCRLYNIEAITNGQEVTPTHSAKSNREHMQVLIEQLSKDRKLMSDNDFEALKQSKFLLGTTLNLTRQSLKKYSAQELHFRFVAEELQWSNLPILDWYDIHRSSGEYAFLKELGVREVPELHDLLQRIIEEHHTVKDLQSRSGKNYKPSIALEFFAKNFQQHYSTLWITSKPEQAFLPSRLPKDDNHATVVLSAPNNVYTDTNPLYPTLLSSVVNLFNKHRNMLLLGIKAKPTLPQAFDLVMERKQELQSFDWACSIFGYLSELEGLNANFIERVSQTSFIPIPGTTLLVKPSEVFIRLNVPQSTIRSRHNKTIQTVDIHDTSGLIDYVDFGQQANLFLSTMGVLHCPTASILATLLLDRQTNYFANVRANNDTSTARIDAYTECLKRLAALISYTSELDTGPVHKRLQTEPWCLGFQVMKNQNNDLKSQYDIVKPIEIFLNDDPQCVSTHKPLCPPNEPGLNKLYEKFGAKWLSDCVIRQMVPVGGMKETNRSKELCTLIRSRVNMLFVNNRGEPIQGLDEKRVEQLRSQLSVYEVAEITCHLTFQNKTITLNSKDGGACALEHKNNKVILYYCQDLLQPPYLDIARELARFVFKKVLDMPVDSISNKLSSTLDELRRIGIPVDHLLLKPLPVPPSPIEPPDPKLQSRENLKPPNIFQKIVRFLVSKPPIIEGPVDHIVPLPPAPIPIQPSDKPRSDLDDKPDGNLRSGKPQIIKDPFEHVKIHDQKILRMVQKSRPYTNSTLIEPSHIETEAWVSCTENVAVNMKHWSTEPLPIPLYVEQELTVTDVMIDHATRLARVLTNLAEHVFKLSTTSLHLFRDINGNRIAFNTNGALFFNLRYFERVFAKDLQDYFQRATPSNDIVADIVNFYFVVTCHELTHNDYKDHGIDFINTLQKVIVEFMPQKELFLRQFSFNQF